ncbi:MAG: hypothetical protein Tsb0034_29600 [Ekhidna sp.]
MAGASLTLGDEFSLFNNVGAMGRASSHAAFAGYQNRYGIPEFQVVGGGLLYNHRIGNVGVGYFKFGDDVFSQQRVHLAVGHKLQMVSLGLGVDLVQYHVESVGTQHALAIQFGGVAEITPQLFFGAHIFNLNQATLMSETNEKLPTVMKGGLSYRPSSELMINLEVEKDLDFKEVIKVGLEYQVVKNVFFRTGISTEPFIGSFGIGFHPKDLKFDYSFSNDSRLGNIHELSVSYAIRK